MTSTWYETVDATTPLMQGDIIFDCPVVAWKEAPLEVISGQEAEALKVATEVIAADVIVMTQACDLENYKVSNAILCPHYSLAEYKTYWEKEVRSLPMPEGQPPQNPTAKAWRSFCADVKEGYQWNLAMLNADEGVNAAHRIVDFHEVYTAPRVFLESLLKSRNRERLRLLPPYREHLSQAFARFFMRVGLPTPIAKAW